MSKHLFLPFLASVSIIIISTFLLVFSKTLKPNLHNPTPAAGCYYQQVQCVRAPCNPILVCPPITSRNCNFDVSIPSGWKKEKSTDPYIGNITFIKSPDFQGDLMIPASTVVSGQAIVIVCSTPSQLQELPNGTMTQFGPLSVTNTEPNFYRGYLNDSEYKIEVTSLTLEIKKILSTFKFTTEQL